jgi:hypothetical protein
MDRPSTTVLFQIRWSLKWEIHKPILTKVISVYNSQNAVHVISFLLKSKICKSSYSETAKSLLIENNII